MDNLSVSIVQSDLAWENKKQNLEHFESRIESLKCETDLVVLPEMFTTGFTMKAEKYAEPLNGETADWMKGLASKCQFYLMGSIIASVKDKYYNRLLSISPDGEVEYYDKRHLFRMGNEHYTYTPGSKRNVIDIKGWKILPLICYDLRFPVWSRNMGDYDMLIYVANWPEARREVWLTLLMARALENQCFVVGVNRIGQDGNALSYAGDSIVVNPYGKIISETKPYKESVETVSLSLAELTEFRQKFPVGMDADEFKII
jgi:omega-amidase